MAYNEAEAAFYQDVREKKLAASGVHSKTGKKGHVGVMRFPSDIMSRKDKMKYRKAGKVMTTNIFDEILEMAEFKELEPFEQKNRLQYWRTNFTTVEIKKRMKISSNTFYKIIQELDLPRAPRAPRKAKIQAAAITPKEDTQEKQQVHEILVEEKQQVHEILVEGIHLVFNGTYTPEHIQNQLLKFAAFLDGESDQFYMELKLVQKPQDK